MLSLVLLVVGMCVQGRSAQLHKFHLEEHVTTKVFSSRAAGVAHAAGNLQYILHDKLESQQAGDIHIVVKLPLGANKQMTEFILDTGSYQLWIKRNNCGAANGGDSLATDCSNAKTPISLFYADGAAHGYSGRTSIWLQGGSVSSSNHLFSVIDSTSFEIKYGILGLAKGNLSPQDAFLPTLKRNQLIQEEAFAIAKRSDGLYLVLGGVDPSWANDQATQVTVPIKSEIAYYIDVDKVTFGSETIIGGTTPALIDSGNSLLSFPWGLKDILVSVFKTSGLDCQIRQETNRNYYQLHCQLEKGQTPQVSDLSITLGGKIFKIPFRDLMIRGDFCREVIPAFADFDSDGPGKELCPMKIEFESGSAKMIIGQVFLEQNYVTFNLEKRTITFIQ